MSDILHEDTFHSTKKGMRRKTVSKRRAYVNTPSQIYKALTEIRNSVAFGNTEKAINQILMLRNQIGR